YRPGRREPLGTRRKIPALAVPDRCRRRPRPLPVSRSGQTFPWGRRPGRDRLAPQPPERVPILAESVRVWPFRSIVMSIVSPGLRSATAAVTSSALATSLPSILVMTSPWANPACSAPEPGVTLATTAPLVVSRPSWRWIGREAHRRDAEEGLRRRLAGLQLVDDRHGLVDGQGEADVLGVAGHGGVDPDDLALGVEQRAAGVARVDGGVGLEDMAQGLGVATRALVPGRDRPVEGRDDALGDRRAAVEGEGVADGHDGVPHDEGVRAADLDRRQAAGVHLEDREVGGG